MNLLLSMALAFTFLFRPLPASLRFSKIGDSITVTPAFLTTFDTKSYYNLGDYQYLQEAVNVFKGSFSRFSLGAGPGWSALGVVAPNLADKDLCKKGETPLECEYRTWQPQYAIIEVGTNDAYGQFSLDDFTTNLNLIVSISKRYGVVPIFSTVPPSTKFDVTNYNNVIRQVAAANNIDLLDYYSVMTTMAPGSGLSPDGIHPSWGPEMSGDLTFSAGMTLRNHLVLEELYRILEIYKCPSCKV